MESCVVSLEISSTYNLLMVAIYRPHSDSVAIFLISLNSLLNSDKLKRKKIFIMGDLNVDLINSSIDGQTFMNELQSLFFTYLINKPTRFPPNNSNGLPTLLDRIWTNDILNFTSGILNLDITDHLPTFVLIPVFSVSPEKIEINFRDHNHSNIDRFLGCLCNLIGIMFFVMMLMFL